MKKRKFTFIIHFIWLVFVVPFYLAGVLLHIVGGTFKTFGYLFQFDIQSAGEIWLDMYDDVRNLRN